jgi:hypothetical protein
LSHSSSPVSVVFLIKKEMFDSNNFVPLHKIWVLFQI